MDVFSVTQKSIYDMLSCDKKFVVPDYQRPYSWTELECARLWDDFINFVHNKTNIDNYFIGPMVFYDNKKDKTYDIIDGQQRLISLLLMLRASYCFFEKKQISTRIGSCIWTIDRNGEFDFNKPKFFSKVIMDSQKNDLSVILKDGTTQNIKSGRKKSLYVSNFNFFYEKIKKCYEYPDFSLLDILNYCFSLMIITDNFDYALEIFMSLNDKGKPLSYVDILKVKFYKYFLKHNRIDYFSDNWKKLEEGSSAIFGDGKNGQLIGLFTDYMYCKRAEFGISDNTTPKLLKFYNDVLVENDNDVIYRKINIGVAFEELISLVDFWLHIFNENCYPINVSKWISILFPLSKTHWLHFVSVYFLLHKNKKILIDNNKFSNFLMRLTAYVLCVNLNITETRSFGPSISNKLSMVYKNQEFSKEGFNALNLETTLENFDFDSKKTITKSLLTWWAYNFKSQNLLSFDETWLIDYVCQPKKYNNKINSDVLESLGNKILIEKPLKNVNLNKKKNTNIVEYFDLYNEKNVTSDYIISRNKNIIDSFINFVNSTKLIVSDKQTVNKYSLLDKPFLNGFNIKSIIIGNREFAVSSFNDFFIKICSELCYSNENVLDDISRNNFLLKNSNSPHFVNDKSLIRINKDCDIYLYLPKSYDIKNYYSYLVDLVSKFDNLAKTNFLNNIYYTLG